MSKTDHPILFSRTLILALLAKCKSMTRRVNGLEEINKNPEYYSFLMIGYIEGKGYGALFQHKETDEQVFIKSHYGRPGHTLWVRENTVVHYNDGAFKWAYSADQKEVECYPEDIEGYTHRFFREKKSGTISCIHMPRFLSRFTLRVKSISIERLQAISTEDIIKEGLTTPVTDKWDAAVHLLHQWTNLWEFINGDGSWNDNPWLWVIEFEQV